MSPIYPGDLVRYRTGWDGVPAGTQAEFLGQTEGPPGALTILVQPLGADAALRVPLLWSCGPAGTTIPPSGYWRPRPAFSASSFPTFKTVEEQIELLGMLRDDAVRGARLRSFLELSPEAQQTVGELIESTARLERRARAHDAVQS
jgi:hypothetical protein